MSCHGIFFGPAVEGPTLEGPAVEETASSLSDSCTFLLWCREAGVCITACPDFDSIFYRFAWHIILERAPACESKQALIICDVDSRMVHAWKSTQCSQISWMGASLLFFLLAALVLLLSNHTTLDSRFQWHGGPKNCLPHLAIP